MVILVMMLNYIPFYENPDTTHCFQAVIRMILKYYLPDREFTWSDLDTITAKQEGLWTWQSAGMLWLDTNGFEVRIVENFDNERFVRAARNYLIERFGQEVGEAQIAHSDIPQEIEYAKQLVARGMDQVHSPTIDELKQRLDEGYVLVCNVNSRVLNGLDGYAGHFVLLIGHDNDGFILHDPGSVGIGVENRVVSYQRFNDAWAYPSKDARNYMAVKQR